MSTMQEAHQVATVLEAKLYGKKWHYDTNMSWMFKMKNVTDLQGIQGDKQEQFK